MEGDGDEQREVTFDIQVPPELEGGVYANFLTVWHTGYEFTFDFASMQPPEVSDPEDPTSPVRMPCRVVTRVKIPPTLAFDVIRAINENMTRYEEAFGEIRRPEEPQEGDG